ncbi:MAG TPA: regulatory protein RecX [Micromonosporaceae bacterium]
MVGRRRGARSGRGWDATPPRTGGNRARRGRTDGADLGCSDAEESRAGAADTRPRDEAELAREVCLRQLAVRPRTRAELAAALARRGISEAVAREVLDRYQEVGMIDDAAFARAWVSSRHQGRGLARRALANELRQRGVDPDTVSDALGQLDEPTEVATARALVDRKLRTMTGSPEAIFRRLAGMLARKGYPPGVAIRVVKDALAERDAEAAEFVECLDTDALIDAELDREGRDPAV